MTYATLALLVVAGCAVVAVAVHAAAPGADRATTPGSARRAVPGPQRARRRRWYAVGLVGALLLVLTVVFDSLMIAADLFRYDDAALLGPRLGLAPVEDLAWPVAAVLLLPAVWELLGRHGRSSAGAAESSAPPGLDRPASAHHRPDPEEPR